MILLNFKDFNDFQDFCLVTIFHCQLSQIGYLFHVFWNSIEYHKISVFLLNFQGSERTLGSSTKNHTQIAFHGKSTPIVNTWKIISAQFSEKNLTYLVSHEKVYFRSFPRKTNTYTDLHAKQNFDSST